MTRPLALLCALVLLGGGGVAVAQERSAPTLTGPSHVIVGEELEYRAGGLRPGARVELYLAPTRSRGGNCCSIRVFRGEADDDGEVRITFTWPRGYRFCQGGECRRRLVGWEDGEQADASLVDDPGDAPAPPRVVRVDATPPLLSATPSRVAPGGRLVLQGRRWEPGSRVALLVGPRDSEGTRVGSVRAGRDGRFRRTLPIDRRAEPGPYAALACRRSCALKAVAPFRIGR